MAWNSLPDFMRDPTSSTGCFRRLLKPKRTCSRDTSASSALGVLNDYRTRYTNPRTHSLKDGLTQTAYTSHGKNESVTVKCAVWNSHECTCAINQCHQWQKDAYSSKKKLIAELLTGSWNAQLTRPCHTEESYEIQEAQLSPRDRAMRRVN